MVGLVTLVEMATGSVEFDATGKLNKKFLRLILLTLIKVQLQIKKSNSTLENHLLKVETDTKGLLSLDLDHQYQDTRKMDQVQQH